MENLNKRSIIDMARGAIKERADYEMTRVVENILDPNTSLIPILRRLRHAKSPLRLRLNRMIRARTSL